MSIHASISRWCLTPRVEVFRAYNHGLTYDNTFSVTIPRRKHSSCEVVGDIGQISEGDIRKVMAFVSKNRDLLIGHWHERPGCSDFDLFDKLRKVSGKITHESLKGGSSATQIAAMLQTVRPLQLPRDITGLRFPVEYSPEEIDE